MSCFCQRSHLGLSLLFGSLLLVTDTSWVSAAGPPSFQGLGALPGSRFGSVARAISDDGTAVTGNSDEADLGGSFAVAYRWQAGVMVPLGDLPGGSNFSESGGISADGSVAAGMSFSTNGTEAFRWEAGVMTGLGDLPGGVFYSHAFDVSGDGTAVVGLSRTEIADYPFRWKGGVLINLSDGFAGTPPTGIATGTSHDGEVVVGMANGAVGTRPFRWDHGVMELLDIPPDALHGIAAAVSPDGDSVVGTITFESGLRRAFLWQAGVMTMLDSQRGIALSGSALSGIAQDVSADGAMVVGSLSTPSEEQAFLWTPVHGIRQLSDVLVQDFDLDLTGWRLDKANGVSADGKTIAGSGLNPAGRSEAWLAHIGCAVAGDFNNNGVCDGGDIAGFVRCVITGLGCGCGDQDGNQVVDLSDLEPFVACLLGPQN